MKTLDQIAEAAGVTKAAIYKRFQGYGLSVNQLKAERRGKTKVFGEDIERLIILMFQPETEVDRTVKISKTEEAEKIKDLQDIAERLEVENKAAKEEIERAGERAEAAEARAERAEARTDALLQQIDKLTDAIRAAEAVQAAQIARLPPPDGENKGGFFERLRKRLKGEKTGGDK